MLKGVLCIVAAAAVVLTAAVAGSASAASPTPWASTAPVPPGEPWIVYQAWDGAPHLRQVRPDGTGDHLLIDGEHPDWSPDGSRIAYVVDDTAVWTVNADGTDAKVLPIPCDAGCQLDDMPAWSPDGSAIAFTRLVAPPDGDPYTDVAAIDLVSGAIRTLYAPPVGEGTFYVRWSPDGQSIVVDINRYPSPESDVVSAGMIAIVDLTMPDPVARPLTDWSMFATYPDWSQDGSSIVFTTNDLGVRDASNQQDPHLASDLYTIRPDGTDLMQLTRNPTSASLIRNGTASGPLSSQPSWTPDGRIVFVEVDGATWPGWRLAVIGADGSVAARPSGAGGSRAPIHGSGQAAES